MTLRFKARVPQLGLAVFLILISQLQACAEKTTEAKTYQQLDQFWQVFRSAALSGNKDVMTQLTQFPFATRGMMDDDPVIYLDRKRFEQNIDIFLNRDPGDPNTPNPETTLDLFKRTQTLKDQGGGFVQLGDLVFEKVDGHWLWVRIFIDGDELK